MFERLSKSLGSLFSDHDVARDDYLASSGDLADLERRMRQIDEEDHAYSMHFCGSVGRQHDAG
ncbi:DUF3563 family protein [Caballeronia ptereochthonis]|jgi:hypothetical protein|uniref:DUF3563 domain-containing protein n=1 Tax=Caballeronia ptereochthonis TaxID=1777144 RepID=A0A158EA60_9BURK|nr:DUF3563 family protein [Caballeronia ptereochthonis]SAL03610.1 hypothetical protein AWB83_06838 [Caballeronia ptereochthonis]